MRLTIVGCAPAYTRRAGRASSCYLVESGAHAVVLDMGQGSFAELARYRAAETLGALLISHLHADHLVDLIPLRHYLRYEAGGTGVALHGPAELAARIDAFQDGDGFLAPLHPSALRAGPVEVEGFEIEAARVTHIPDSWAFRVAPAGGDDRPGLVYSGDCGVAADLLPLIRPGDTLLCEAALGTDAASDEPAIHLTAAQAAWAAAQGGAGRLVLTHVLDRYEDAALLDAADTFAGPVELARPGLVVEIGG